MTRAAARLETYFDEAAPRFRAAAERAGDGPAPRLTIADRTLHLKFAGTALARKILPGFGHLARSSHAEPDLTVALWDFRSTGTMLPPPPWDALEYRERGNARFYDDDRFSVSYDRRTDVFSAVDVERRLGLYWTRDADALPNYTAAAPMHRLLQGWLRTRGLYAVHAAAIGRADGGLLMAGRGGSGKSTTAVLSLLSTTLSFAGDDFALVQADPSPYVHSLYATAKLNRDALDRVPELSAVVANADRLDREKALLLLSDRFAHKLVAGFPLAAIVLPSVGGQPASVVTPASPLSAYRAIGPDSALTMLGDPRGVLAAIKRLVQERPCYHLALGTDRQGIYDALAGILAQG